MKLKKPSSSSTNPVALFYKTKEQFGCFSNFSAHKISYRGHLFPTSEHFFQALKFVESPSDFNEVLAKPSPMHAACVGRTRSRPLRSDWESKKERAMLLVLLLKFSQNPDALRILLATKDCRIVEHSMKDKYWGDGGDKGTGECGRNRLGELLMECRDFFRTIVEDSKPLASVPVSEVHEQEENNHGAVVRQPSGLWLEGHALFKEKLKELKELDTLVWNVSTS